MSSKETFLKELTLLWGDSKEKLIKEAKEELMSQQNQIDFSKEAIKEIPISFGIYLFQVKPVKEVTLEDLLEIWEDDNRKLGKTPKPIKSRFVYNKEEQYQPFYLGKAENLSKRINEHCFQESHKTTYGLKLKWRERLRNEMEINYNYYPIPFDSDSVVGNSPIQFLITNLESEIRKEIKPWVGKQ